MGPIESGCAQVDGSHHIHEHRASINVTTSIYNQLGSIDLLLHLGGLSFAKGYGSVVSGTFSSQFYCSLFFILYSGTLSLTS